MIDRALIRPFDLTRAFILKKTMKARLLRLLFADRIVRNNATAALSIVINVAFMVWCPLWALMLAPSVLGMAHLIESLNAFHDCAVPLSRTPSIQLKQSINQGLIFFCCCFLSTRILFFLCEYAQFFAAAVAIQTHQTHVDFCLVAISFFYFSYCYRLKTPSVIIGLTIILGTFFILLEQSGMVWGLFVFSHNFMAFYFWYHYAPTPQEKRSAIFFAFLVMAIHGLVLSPWVDDLLFTVPIDQRYTGIFGYDFIAISSDLFPANFELLLARKVVSLLCFGQGVHYILWIRIIPDCHFSLKAPLSFRAQWRILQRDFGKKLSMILLALFFLFIASAITRHFDFFNQLFFGLAFFHIYAEFLAVLLRWLGKNNSLAESL